MRPSMLLLCAAPFAAGTAAAETDPGQAGQTQVTVRAPERLICRPQVRTATRMRATRTCRIVRQDGSEVRGQDEELARAADALDVYGERVSTGDGIDEDLDVKDYRTPDTPRGPR